MSVSQAHLASLADRNEVVIQQRGVSIMVMNRIQFQPGLSMPDFLRDYETEAQCEQTLEAARGPTGFHCASCEGSAHYVVRDGVSKFFNAKHAGTKPR